MICHNPQSTAFSEKYGIHATISSVQLRKNISIVKEHVPSTCAIIAVIKSDAYGHGAVELANEFMKNNIGYFAVSDIAEAFELRRNGIASPILILSPVPVEYVQDIVENYFIPAVSSLQFIQLLHTEAVKQDKRVRVHVKVDTGMGRFGITPEQTITFLREIKQYTTVHVEGIFSHLSSTFSNDTQSNTYTVRQIKKLDTLLDELAGQNLLPKMVHLGSSTGLIGFPDYVSGNHYNAIRIGTLFLGFEERLSDWESHPLPICALQTRMLAVRSIQEGAFISYDRQYQAGHNLKLGVLPVGYAHGIHRDLSKGGSVIVQGRRCPIIGKITLGNTMVDVTGLDHVGAGDPVELFGINNSAYEQGQQVHRGTWEILLPLLQRCNLIDYRIT